MQIEVFIILSYCVIYYESDTSLRSWINMRLYHKKRNNK